GIVQTPTIKAAGLDAPAKPATLSFTAPNAQGDAEMHVEREKAQAAPGKKAKKK
ncbi:MAG: Protein translocase subunit SecA, partial [Micrococcaceae bacterium]|nr:Protein translocase subunit SecA [Micrococcaceae bacterium]